MKKKGIKGKAAYGIAAGAIAASLTFLPGCSMNECVYGPPDDTSYSSEDNIPVAIYGPPEAFEPSENQNEDVYGPPEAFDSEYNSGDNTSDDNSNTAQ